MGQAYIDFLERRIDELTAQLASTNTGGTLRGVTGQTDWDDGLYVHEPDYSPGAAPVDPRKDVATDWTRSNDDPVIMVFDGDILSDAMSASMMDVIRQAFESLDYYADDTPDWEVVDAKSLIDYANRADQEASLRRNQPVETSSELIRRISEEIAAEATRAATIHAPLHSPHEAISVIREEFEELWDHVKADTGLTKDARKEAVQLGAMALRYILNLIDQPKRGGKLDKPSSDPVTLQDVLNSVMNRS